jgi:hypothetical protein
MALLEVPVKFATHRGVAVKPGVVRFPIAEAAGERTGAGGIDLSQVAAVPLRGRAIEPVQGMFVRHQQASHPERAAIFSVAALRSSM